MAVTERNRTETEVILAARKKPFQSIDELVEACLPRLAARLWAACRWTGTMGCGWHIGEFNYLVASVRPDPDSSLFVQFWSEPGEPVLAEVCSGELNPTAIEYIRQPQRELLEGFGYGVGARPGNFEKEIRVTSAAEAEDAGREGLRILFEVFGYRGQWPLELEWHEGERADPGRVYSSLTVEDLAKVARGIGLNAECTTGQPPVVFVGRGRKQFLVGLLGQVPHNNLYSVALFQVRIASREGIADDAMARMGETLRFARLSREDAHTAMLVMPVRFDGGVTVAWISAAFQHWLAEWRACQRALKGADSGEGTTGVRPGPADARVH